MGSARDEHHLPNVVACVAGSLGVCRFMANEHDVGETYLRASEVSTVSGRRSATEYAA